VPTEDRLVPSKLKTPKIKIPKRPKSNAKFFGHTRQSPIIEPVSAAGQSEKIVREAASLGFSWDLSAMGRDVDRFSGVDPNSKARAGTPVASCGEDGMNRYVP